MKVAVGTNTAGCGSLLRTVHFADADDAEEPSFDSSLKIEMRAEAVSWRQFVDRSPTTSSLKAAEAVEVVEAPLSTTDAKHKDVE